MRKIVLLGMTVLGLLCFAGCNKQPGEKSGQNEWVAVSEDYVQGNTTTNVLTPMIKTEKGHYYYSDTYKGLRYFDIATGKDMYLCNKPECRHDGNEFCVATNQKYRLERFAQYNDRLYASAIEETETEYLYKLLAIALDGSEMSEVATYMRLAKSGQVPDGSIDDSSICIHRNKAIIPMSIWGMEGALPGAEKLSNITYYGTAILDLDTKEVTYLDETPLSKENTPATNLSAYGDHLYYCKKEGKKIVLHRYSVTDGSDESYKLLTGFKGEYVVLDENTVVYLKSSETMLCVHDYSTGENTEKVQLKKIHTLLSGGYEVQHVSEHRVTVLAVDGTYLYVSHGTHYDGSTVESEEGEEEAWIENHLRIFDYDLNELVMVDLIDSVAIPGAEDGEELVWEYANDKVHFMGEEIYCDLISTKDPRTMDVVHSPGNYVVKCNRSDLLQGKVDFEFVYKKE